MLGTVDPIDGSVTEALNALRLQLEAGLSPARALGSCSHLCRHPRARAAFEEAARLAAEGTDFAELLDRLAGLLSRAERVLLAAGWEAGRIERALAAVVRRREALLRARRRIRARLVLSVLVFLAACLIAPLPALFLGGEVATYVRRVLTPLAVAVALVLAFRALLRHRTRQWATWREEAPPPVTLLDRLLLALPLVGHVERWRNLSQFGTTLAHLLEAGLRILPALASTARSLPNAIVGHRVWAIRRRIEGGQPLASALAESGAWPEEWISSLEVAEEAGEEPQVLHRLGEQAEQKYLEAIEEAGRWLPRLVYGLVALFVVWHILAIASRLPTFGGGPAF